MYFLLINVSTLLLYTCSSSDIIRNSFLEMLIKSYDLSIDEQPPSRLLILSSLAWHLAGSSPQRINFLFNYLFFICFLLTWNFHVHHKTQKYFSKGCPREEMVIKSYNHWIIEWYSLQENIGNSSSVNEFKITSSFFFGSPSTLL